MFARGDTVVGAQRGVWRAPDSGAVAGAADIASVFRVGNGRVTRVARFDELEDALAAAGLGETDEVETK